MRSSRYGFLLPCFMKWFFLLAFVFLSCQDQEQRAHPVQQNSDSNVVQQNKIRLPDNPSLIVPGERLGKVKLNEDVSSLQVLGPPDLSNAAMGKAWLTWKGKRDEHNNATELNIYTTYADSTMRHKTVQQVRTTSSYFSTAKDVHVYSSLQEVQNEFPLVRKVASYNDDGRHMLVFDERAKGIAFELARAGEEQIVTGIIIHEKGKAVTNIYISLHPNMHLYQ